MSPLRGKRIVGIDHRKEEDYGFDGGGSLVVIELDDGTELFAMQDEEGNGPGVLMLRTKLSDEYVEDEYVE